MLLESDDDDDDFVLLDFCMGRTKLSVWIEEQRKRAVDFVKDENAWITAISIPKAQEKAKEIKIIINSSTDEKQKIKEYCEKVNWNQEIRLADLDAITYLCVI